MITAPQNPGTASTAGEREELKRVLRSNLFTRAPTLAHLLAYLCEKSFAGESNQIKEYSVGIDVFHRSPDFESGGRLHRSRSGEPAAETPRRVLRWRRRYPSPANLHSPRSVRPGLPDSQFGKFCRRSTTCDTSGVHHDAVLLVSKLRFVAIDSSSPACSDAGNNDVVIRHFSNLEADAQGKLLLEFIPIKGYATVTGIEVLPQ